MRAAGLEALGIDLEHVDCHVGPQLFVHRKGHEDPVGCLGVGHPPGLNPLPVTGVRWG